MAVEENGVWGFHYLFLLLFHNLNYYSKESKLMIIVISTPNPKIMHDP